MPSRWTAKVEELRALAATRTDPTLPLYLEHAELDRDDVYDGGRTWSDLRAAAGLATHPASPQEAALRRSCARMFARR